MSVLGRLKSYAALGLDWLLDQYDEAGNFQRIIKAIGDEIQESEDAVHDLLADRFLFHDNKDRLATGAALDQYGELVNLLREGRSDSEYRELIRVKVLKNTSEGTPPRLIEILSRLTNANTVTVDEGPAVAEMQAIDTNVLTGVRSLVGDWLDEAAPSGVRIRALEIDSQTSFQYDDGPGYDDGEYAHKL